MRNADRPAYPIVSDLGYPTATVNLTNDTRDELCSGLTKREYFAAMALQGMLANPELIGDAEFGAIAKLATEHADELLKELDK